MVKSSLTSFPRHARSLAVNGYLPAVFLLSRGLMLLREWLLSMCRAKGPIRRFGGCTKTTALVLILVLILPMTVKGLLGAQLLLTSNGIEVQVISGYYMTTQALLDEGLNYIAKLSCRTFSRTSVDVWIVVNHGNVDEIVVQTHQGVI